MPVRYIDGPRGCRLEGLDRSKAELVHSRFNHDTWMVFMAEGAAIQSFVFGDHFPNPSLAKQVRWVLTDACIH